MITHVKLFQSKDFSKLEAEIDRWARANNSRVLSVSISANTISYVPAEPIEFFYAGVVYERLPQPQQGAEQQPEA